jgi:NAD(P)-dependent dehydrogenase (short-subunit alcohol dehydrogenase family)
MAASNHEETEAPVALVTGASRGIGRKTAEHLAGAGFDVALAARTLREGEAPEHFDGTPLTGSLEETAERVRALGRRALCLRFDLARRESASEVVDALLSAWGRLDVLVNNALLVAPTSQARLLDVSPDDFVELVDANVASVVALIQRAIASMQARSEGPVERMVGGRIINAERQARWRPAWFLDLETSDGPQSVIFRGAKLEVEGGVETLRHEFRCLELLEKHGIEVPHRRWSRSTWPTWRLRSNRSRPPA